MSDVFGLIISPTRTTVPYSKLHYIFLGEYCPLEEFWGLSAFTS